MGQGVSRRQLVHGLAAGVPLAAVLSSPALAQAVAATLTTVTGTTPSGRTVQASLAVPAKLPAPAVMLIHEFWGLNDQIRAVAAEAAREGMLALAIDLYGGAVASEREAAKKLMEAVDPAAATETVAFWIQWLKARKDATGKVATLGWCFGGGWSLNASIAEPVDATVIYYGRVDRPAEQLARLKGPVLGHFASRDPWINAEMVGGFEKAMATAGKPLTVYWYDADHAFANPTGARYDADDATLAWQRTLAFLKQTLGV
ncbi:MAG: dienelactone hydrolase family protein [Defluviicoccus sp.]|nr:dienelactone hydrolase family protein [Defluviicoccus sp.]